MVDLTSEARVVTLDRLWPDDIAGRSGDVLDVVFGWADLTTLRRLVAGECAAVGLTGSRLDDFVLAVHEIAANAIVHAGAGGRLILRRAASGLRCLISDHVLQGGEDPAAPGCRVPRARDGSIRLAALGVTSAGMRDSDPADPHEPTDAESGRGLWLAAQLTDELSITTGPDSTVVSLYVRFE